MREPESLSPGLRFRRGMTLLLVTLLVPGAAQVAAGNRTTGRAALRVYLIVLALTVLMAVGWFVRRPFVLGLVTRPVLLLVLLLALVAGAVAWMLLFLDAWRLSRPRLLEDGARTAVTATAFLLVLVTAGPMLYGANLVFAQRDLIAGVFGSGIRSEAVDGRYNVLLLGADADPDRPGVRPDSIQLVSVDADTGRSVLFALPRNLQNIPWPQGSPADRAQPEGFACGDACLLNAVYSYGEANPELFPGEAPAGAEAMMQAVQAVTGLHVNYYVLIDMGGFRDIINAMGGIEVTVGSRVPIGGGTSPVTGYVEPGSQTLDGYHALWLARSREGSSDYERMARQRCVMTAMATQLDPQTVLTRFTELAEASEQVVQTNIPDEDLGTFVDLALKAKSQPITSVQFVPPLITPATPDLAQLRAIVEASIDESEDADQQEDADQDQVAPSDSGQEATDGADPSPQQPGDDAQEGTENPSEEGPAAAEDATVDARSVCSAG